MPQAIPFAAPRASGLPHTQPRHCSTPTRTRTSAPGARSPPCPSASLLSLPSAAHSLPRPLVIPLLVPSLLERSSPEGAQPPEEEVADPIWARLWLWLGVEVRREGR
eukprot:1161837-Pelagomonas_calceolata.AAC.13